MFTHGAVWMGVKNKPTNKKMDSTAPPISFHSHEIKLKTLIKTKKSKGMVPSNKNTSIDSE